MTDPDRTAHLQPGGAGSSGGPGSSNGADAAPTRSAAAAGRRRLSVALVCCTLGAAVVLLAAGQPWARAELTAAADVPVLPVTLTGRDLAPLAAGLGLLALAAAAALVATRGLARQLLGFVVLAAGVATVVDAVLAGGRVGGAVAGRLPGASTAVSTSAWSWVAVAGGLAVVAAGAVTARHGRGWVSMSSRYDAPAATGAPAADRDRTARPARSDPQDDAWRALDRGEDPTARPATDRDPGRPPPPAGLP